MSKIKKLFISAFAVVALGLGVAFNPVTAYAEDSAAIPEISAEIETSEEVVEDSESVENSEDIEAETQPAMPSEDKEITLDDLFDFVGSLAEEEGLSNEWDKAVENLKNAASEKKVDIMTILSACNIGLLSIYILVKLIKGKIAKKNDTTQKDISEIKTASGQQTKAVNGLIEEEEKIVEGVEDNTKREKALAQGIEKQNVAIRCLIRGTNIKQDLKDEALRALNDSDDLCDIAKK